MNNVTIVGLGAIGTVYAAALSDAGIPLRVAVNNQRRERYERDGVYFNDKWYNFQYFTPSEGDHEADLVIITTKSSGLSEALELIRPIVGKNTHILPLLNGITSEEICTAMYGFDRVLYGYFIGHTASRIRNKIYQDGQYKTFFGERYNSNITSRVTSVKSLFEKASIPYEIPVDMISSLWQKFVINIGMNQATAVLRCTYGHLQKNEFAKKYMLTLMAEAARIAVAKRISGAEKMVLNGAKLLDNLSPEDGSSMYQDVISGRATEVDIFADVVCELGAKHKIATPYNFHASVILKAL